VVAADNTVSIEIWGYRYVLENGDVVEVGDSATEDFRPYIKTIRGAYSYTMGWGNDTYTASLNDMTVSFDFNRDTTVSIYPVAPDERINDWRIEYDVTLTKKTNQTSIIFNVDWEGITWQKIYGLDVEYDEAACEDKWGTDAAPYTITPTSITGSDLVVYKTRAEWEVNSYVGTAIDPTLTNTEVIGINKNNGLPITRTSPSRTHLRILRGHMTDALDNTAYVEDIILDEQAKTMEFVLPADWLKTANYPVKGVCGVDPAYTEDMQYFLTSDQLGSDGWNADIDFNSIFGAPVSSVCEVIFGNQEAGVENTFGLRNTSSALNRYVSIHEAEGGGMTHCRMFVQLDGSGLCDVYHSDVSDDDYFYLVGYWENVTFTELNIGTYTTSGIFEDETLDDGANCVHHLIGWNNEENSNTMGVRANGSSLDRKIVVHEAESGGQNWIDFIVKADASKVIEVYTSDVNGASFTDSGYFDSSLDFVELWSEWHTPAAWSNKDLTGFDSGIDSNVADMMLVHNNDAATATMGVRANGSGLTRSLLEHEAESADHSTPEYTGFSMSVQTDADGVIEYYSSTANWFAYLTGYFKPAASYAITNTPSSENLGVVADNTTYYAYGSAPSNPVTDGECTFTLTNSGIQCDLDGKITDFSGTTSWNIVSGTPGANEVRVTWYASGMNPASGIVLANTDQEIYDALAGSGTTLKWDFKIEFGALTDEAGAHSATMTITAVAED